MSQSSHLTIGEIAKIFDEPDWKIRRIVDSLPDEIQRVGRYRLVPRSLLAQLRQSSKKIANFRNFSAGFLS